MRIIKVVVVLMCLTLTAIAFSGCPQSNPTPGGEGEGEGETPSAVTTAKFLTDHGIFRLVLDTNAKTPADFRDGQGRNPGQWGNIAKLGVLYSSGASETIQFVGDWPVVIPLTRPNTSSVTVSVVAIDKTGWQYTGRLN